MILNVALWLTGVVLIVAAVFQARGPYSRLTELDRLAENARRYDSWRGGRSDSAADGGTTGAQVMRAMLRRRVLTWAVIAVVGALLILAGFAIR